MRMERSKLSKHWRTYYPKLKEPARTNMLNAFRDIVNQDTKEGYPDDECNESCCRTARWFQDRLIDIESTLEPLK